jgi:hypothetical protein
MLPPSDVPLRIGVRLVPLIRAPTESSCGFPADVLRRAADAAGPEQRHPAHMRTKKGYAVWWQEGAGSRHAGKLQLGRLHLLLSGNGSGRIAVPLDQIVTVDYRRGELQLHRRFGSDITIGNLDGPGVLLELSDFLAA